MGSDEAFRPAFWSIISTAEYRRRFCVTPRSRLLVVSEEWGVCVLLLCSSDTHRDFTASAALAIEVGLIGHVALSHHYYGGHDNDCDCDCDLFEVKHISMLTF